MPYIFLVPSEHLTSFWTLCPWKLLLQLQLFLLLALRSSAVSGWFRVVLPRPEQWEWQVWLIPPSRQNLPCSKGWKISVSNLPMLPFVPTLHPHCGSAPCARAGTIVPSQESFAGVLLTLGTLLYLHEMFVEFLSSSAAVFSFVQGLEQKWEVGWRIGLT